MRMNLQSTMRLAFRIHPFVEASCVMRGVFLVAGMAFLAGASTQAASRKVPATDVGVG